MTIVLSATSDVLPGRSPIVGEPVEAEAAAHTLARMRDEVDTCVDRSSQALTSLAGLSATAIERLHDRVHERVVPSAKQLSADLSEAARAFDGYATDIEHIHVEARRILDEVEQRLARIRVCATDLGQAARALRIDAVGAVPSAWYDRPSAWPPVPSSETGERLTPAEALAGVVALDTWRTSAAAWASAADHLRDCQTRWSVLRVARCEAEHTLIARLRATSAGSLLDIVGAFHRATVTRQYTGAAVHPSRWRLDPQLREVIGGWLTPVQVAERWRTLGLSDAEVARLPIPVLFGLASADGVPFRVQDLASRAALQYALDHPDEAFLMMGLNSAETSMDAFQDQVVQLQAAVDAAARTAATLPGAPAVQMIGFGTHDGALTAAISFGNVDTATSVGVNVLGMGSHVGDLQNGVGGAEQLYRASQSDDASTVAVITWVGYRSPAMPPTVDVLRGERAVAGAAPLARFIDGVRAVRDGDPQLRDFTVLAHSYGSTTAAEALTFTATRVDAFVAYGSAGFEPGTSVDQLHADRVFVTQALGDQVAGAGQLGSWRTNPLFVDGAVWFSSERQSAERRVTAHDLFTADDDPSVWNWGGKVGYLSAGTHSLQVMGRIVSGAVQ